MKEQTNKQKTSITYHLVCLFFDLVCQEIVWLIQRQCPKNRSPYQSSYSSYLLLLLLLDDKWWMTNESRFCCSAGRHTENSPKTCISNNQLIGRLVAPLNSVCGLSTTYGATNLAQLFSNTQMRLHVHLTMRSDTYREKRKESKKEALRTPKGMEEKKRIPQHKLRWIEDEITPVMLGAPYEANPPRIAGSTLSLSSVSSIASAILQPLPRLIWVIPA